MDNELIGKINSLLKKVSVIGYTPGAPNAASEAFYELIKEIPGDSPLWEKAVSVSSGELPLAVAAAAIAVLPPQFTNYRLKYKIPEEKLEGTVGMILITLNTIPENFDLWDEPVYENMPNYTYLDFHRSINGGG